MNRRHVWLLALSLSFLLGGCHRNTGEFAPQLDYAVQDHYLQQLPAPFPPLTEAEKHEDWGKEYSIGVGFSHQLDLYQAMTAFKRAEILTPTQDTQRLLEMRYDIVLCYYLGHKYAEVVYAFEKGSLRTVTPEFPAFHDLLVILYDSYQQLGEPEKAEYILSLLRTHYPATAEKLTLSHAFTKADFPSLKQFAATPATTASVKPFLDSYNHQRKKPGRAQLLNAVMPGAGYLYLGQTQSALTAFFLNGLFLWATSHFYLHNQIAAGTIFLSFELGWYFGGIFGAGLEAKYYNERIYEQLATPVMNNERLFPVLMLQYGF
jgi:hypothetical protein